MVKSSKQPIHGWINLYKPLGMTSTQAVGAVKRILKPQKIGHAGTLDPLAEGVLPLALGEATKTVPYMMDAQKQYGFTIRWGEARSTDDAEGDVVATSEIRPSREQIEAILPQFTGTISQIPPAYSAIKVDGKRAYDLARAGEEVALKSREVTIFSLTCESATADEASFMTTCSKGTYIRSLARDIAKALGTVGYVSALKRLKVGKFCAEATISLDFLEKLVHNPPTLEELAASDWLLPVSDALDDIPALSVDKQAATKLRQGQTIPNDSKQNDSEIAVFVEGKLLAIVQGQAGILKPKRVFNL